MKFSRLSRFAWSRLLGAEEVEVATLMGLSHVIQEKPAVTPFVVWLRRLPVRPASSQLFPGDAQLELPAFHVQLYKIPVLHKRERSAHCSFGVYVQDDRAIGSSAHPGVGDAHHVRDPLLQELCRDRELAPLGHAWRPSGSGVFEH